MAGMACVEQILKYAPRFDVTVFGDETHVNYNRVLLSSVLAGEKAADDIVVNPLEWYQRNDIDAPRRRADRRCRSGRQDGHRRRRSVTRVRRLLLATGSSAWLPPIEGLDKDGVFAFRTLDDTRALLRARGTADEGGRDWRRAARPRGGARPAGAGLRRHRRPPDAHADGAPARSRRRPLPARKMEDLGIKVLLGRTTTAVLGNGHVEGVALSDDTCVEADLVVVAAGIRPERRSRATRPDCTSIAASSSTTTWRPRRRASSPSASASSTAASATGWWRRCSSRARCSRPPSPATRDRPTPAPSRRRSSRSWASTSSQPATGASRTRNRSASRTARLASTRS